MELPKVISLDCLRGVHTPPFRALKKGMYPETNTLPKQHTPSLQGGVVDFINFYWYDKSMNKSIFMAVCLLCLMALCIPANVYAQTRKVEISFDYLKISKMASNQFAVWIEDAQGKYITTLYATKFTATGGWKKREQSLPLWVKQSNVAGMNKKQIDAITGSTPKSGSLRYTWDGKDSNGKAVPDGKYTIILEASLYQENQVLYTTSIELDSTGRIVMQPQYSGSSEAERSMISAVTITF